MRSGSGDWNLALLSRKPIRSHRTIPLPQLPLDPSTRMLLEAEVDVDGTNLTVIGTHFSHLEFGRRPPDRAPCGAACRRPTAPAVFLGDMNMWGWTIDAMTPSGWRRARPREDVAGPPTRATRSTTSS